MISPLLSEAEPINLAFLNKISNLIQNDPVFNETAAHSQSVSPNILSLNIDNTLMESLKIFAGEIGVSLIPVFVTAFNVILQRYTGQENILIEQAFVENWQLNKDGTHKAGIESICSELKGSDTFADVLKNLHLFFSSRSGSTDMIFNTIENIHFDERSTNFFFLSQTPSGRTDSQQKLRDDECIRQLSTHYENYYLGLIFDENEENLKMSLFANPRQLGTDFTRRFGEHLINLLHEITEKPDLCLGAYQILGTEEMKRLLYDFNDTVCFYPKEKSLFELFEEQVMNHPDQIALLKGKKQITYNELNKQSNRLAHYLISEGVLPGDNVGILVNRGFEMIIGILAILKAGGAYVPIDPEYPIDRQEYIYHQSLLKFVIADDNYPLKLFIKENDFKLIDLDTLLAFEQTNPGLKIDSGQVAYTIYTSGSTGKPKGVMIAHHSAVNLVLWVNNTFKIGINDRLLFVTSMCFDLSVYDIFGILAAGGTLVIAENNEIRDVRKLYNMLVEYGITFWDSVPTTMDYLVKTLAKEDPGYRYNGLKTVFLSGDWIPVDLPDRLKEFFPKVNVVSLGGATEATVWSNFFVVEKCMASWTSIPYGRPISNNFFYILNDQLKPVPVGTVGDLYIGGVGVALGYANDTEKTKKSFIPDLFNPGSGGMMYRTGDLGRMMPDYNMEFIGRKDNQVKIQGYRVELGEIESVLNSSGQVSNAIVLAKNDNDGIKKLVACVVFADPNAEQQDLISYLKKHLPDYMIPAVWIKLEHLPLTANGKIDRNALSAMGNFSTAKTIAEPETETERVLVKLWNDYFKKTELDINSNFFDIGGHSLMAVQILSKLKEIFTKNLQPSIFYKYPTIKSLAMFIDKESNDNNFKSLVPIKPSGTKKPLYIIHGDGLNVLNFNHLSKCVDQDQPVYGLQALGLNGIDEPIDHLPLIAYRYMQEIIQHNPEGPYLLAGYSSGGYVAMEIRKQMVALGKKVKMLIIFDTDAEKTEYKDWYSLLPKKAKRHFPRLFQVIKMSVNKIFRKEKIEEFSCFKHNNSKEFYKLIKKIKNKHITAFRNYVLEPFDDKLFLYKAKVSVHYSEYGEFLGWEKYAKKGVEVFEIPGDHFSMLLPPHVADLGTILQKNIDEQAD